MTNKNTLVFTSQYGEFATLLHHNRAPVTCEYFSDLARNGGLGNASVFRIVSELNHQPADPCPINVVQIGPLQGITGDRHPIAHEDTKSTGLSHRKWTVSAARFDLGELYGSFFVCMRDEPDLNYGGCRQPDGQGFAAFGQVIEGFETMDRIYQCAEADEMLTNEIPIFGVSLTETPIDIASGEHHGA